MFSVKVHISISAVINLKSCRFLINKQKLRKTNYVQIVYAQIITVVIATRAAVRNVIKNITLLHNDAYNGNTETQSNIRHSVEPSNTNSQSHSRSNTQGNSNTQSLAATHLNSNTLNHTQLE